MTTWLRPALDKVYTLMMDQIVKGDYSITAVSVKVKNSYLSG